MGLKKTIKRIAGPKNVDKILAIKGLLKYISTSFLNSQPKLEIQSKEWEKFAVYEKPGMHLFFGYYDIQQFDSTESKLLVTEIPKKADTKKDSATLEWIDTKTGEYHFIGDTQAWCWQQGARLRWHPTKNNCVLYNDIENGRYVTRVYDIEKEKQIEIIPMALYDIAPNGRFGLSLNYSRLQRLRPGYGYNGLPDDTVAEKVPKLDGIYSIDLESGKTNLIISIEQLTSLAPGSENAWNYINHISISPDSKRFLFFHLWTPGIGEHWHNRMYIADFDGSNLTCIEDEYITSHYCWKDSNVLLTTTVGFGNSSSLYILYDIENRIKQVLPSKHLKKDGHPNFMANSTHFLTDTYPMDDCRQHLFLESIERSQPNEVCTIYSDPRMFGEKRCDLHPRITKSNKYISIDSTFNHGKRSVVVFKHK